MVSSCARVALGDVPADSTGPLCVPSSVASLGCEALVSFSGTSGGPAPLSVPSVSKMSLCVRVDLPCVRVAPSGVTCEASPAAKVLCAL